MTETAWKAFTKVREKHRKYSAVLGASLPDLAAAQKRLIAGRQGGAYPLETPVVYNQALDDVKREDDIRLILAADNPGRREQAAENRRYLVGPSGKIADRFFRGHPELGIDFRKNVIILNKTPIHTPRTAELHELGRIGGPEIAAAIMESQRDMVRLLADFYRALRPVPVWIIGYSEMRRKGIFEIYTEELKQLCRRETGLYESLYFYRHFSMNQFTIDLGKQRLQGESVQETLERLGAAYRERILG